MRSSLSIYILTATLAVAASGCSAPNWFSKKPEPEAVAGPPIKAPADRVLELRELAEQGLPADPATIQQQSQVMAEEYRREGDPIVRAQLVRTLGPYPTDTTAQVLREALQDPDSTVRVTACEAWGKRADQEASNVLSRVLKHDDDIDTRLAAAAALGDIKDQSSVEALGSALEDSDPALQYRAVRSLERVTGKDFGDDVNAWRQYVSTGQPPQQNEESIAQRFFSIFR